MWMARWSAALRLNRAVLLKLLRIRFRKAYGVFNWSLYSGDGVGLRAADFSGAHSASEKGRGRGPGFRRQRNGCSVRRRFGNGADQDNEVLRGGLLCPGNRPVDRAEQLSSPHDH